MMSCDDRAGPSGIITREAPSSSPWRGKVEGPRRCLQQEIRKKPTFRRLLLAVLAARLTRPRDETCRVDVECWPGLPYHRHMFWKAALYAGIRLLPYRGGEPAAGGTCRPRLRLFWPSVDPAGVPGLPPPAEWWPGALNGGSRKPGKRMVEQAFGEAFGYSLAVDPTTHVGPCVAKSAFGSTHDGRLLDCPIAATDPALAYEVLVDNRVDAGTVLDFRVPVIGGKMPFVYLKYRPLRTRFSNTNSAVALARSEDAFSEGERERLQAFCCAMRLDLVELDVLRDRNDGRIYIVDANRPVWGPPRPLRTANAVRAVRAYAAAFARLVERGVRSA